MTVTRLILMACAVALLSACGPRPMGDTAPLAPVEIGVDTIAGAGGTELALTSWAPRGRPEAVILALHGFGDTGANTYDWAARAWAREGLLTYAYDHRGFGANPSRKEWPGAEVLAADAVAVSRALRARHPGLPLIVIGHSMGGGVTLAAAAEGLEADGLVLAGPAISGGDRLSPVLRAGGWALGAFSPDRRFTGGDNFDVTPTDNRAALRRAADDPWHFADASGRELWGLVRVSDRAARAAPKVTVPVLTLMGARDDYVPVAGVRAIHERIPGAQAFILYPEGYHWLFRDLQAQRVWDDVAAFVRAVAQAQ